MTADASQQIIVARTRFRHSPLVDRILFVDVVHEPFLERLQVPALRQGYPWRSFVRAPLLAYRATVSVPSIFGSGVAAQPGPNSSFVTVLLGGGAEAGRLSICGHGCVVEALVEAVRAMRITRKGCAYTYIQ